MKLSVMYIYDRKLSGLLFRPTGQVINSRPAQRNPYSLDRISSRWADAGLGQLSAEALSQKLIHLSLLPHFVERTGKDVLLEPTLMDPGIYDGAKNYKIAPRLQDCLKAVIVMEKGNFRHIKVALVDLTKNVMQPEFAASFDHKTP